uniref:Uncharacterized protein n=1 Tax=viral metagenome TaxID=1070528 RepID=A0A6H1ZH75_9ZZZZ
MNVVVEDGELAKREGFSEYEDAVNSTTSILNMTVAKFASGRVDVVVKLADGVLYQRQVHPSAETSFTAITGGQTHSGSDRGWFYLWSDRLFHFDSVGGTQWNPSVNSGVAYKAGLPRPTTGPTIAAAAGGEKDGRYHVHVSYRDNRTKAEGVVSGAQTGASMPLECRVDGDTGGIAVSNWSTIRAADSAYEWDEAQFWSTLGSTEYIERGPVECFSFVGYLDAVIANSQVAMAGLNKADHVLATKRRFTNAGGEPPGATIGCFTGTRAIYGGIYGSVKATLSTALAGDNNDLTYTARVAGPSGNAITVAYTSGASAGNEVVTVTGSAISVQVASGVSTSTQVLAKLRDSSAAYTLVSVANAAGNDGSGAVVTMGATNLTGGAWGAGTSDPTKILYSIPNYPTMVPQEITYTLGGDSTTFDPQPYVAEIVSGVGGAVTEIAHGGGVAAAYTATSTWEFHADGRGRLYPAVRHSSVGCAGAGAAVGTPEGVHALGFGVWGLLTQQSWRDIANGRFATTIREIPVGYESATRMGYYSYADQVWAAVVKSGSTVAQRILVWDRSAGQVGRDGRPAGGLVAFDPAGLAASESITALCELASPAAAPTMLVATNKGRIWQYPRATGEGDGPTPTHYAAEWLGYFGQELAGKVTEARAELHNADNVSGNVDWEARVMRTADESLTARTGTLQKTDKMEVLDTVAFDARPGRMYQLKLSSASDVEVRWAIRGLYWTVRAWPQS